MADKLTEHVLPDFSFVLTFEEMSEYAHTQQWWFEERCPTSIILLKQRADMPYDKQTDTLTIEDGSMYNNVSMLYGRSWRIWSKLPTEQEIENTLWQRKEDS